MATSPAIFGSQQGSHTSNCCTSEQLSLETCPRARLCAGAVRCMQFGCTLELLGITQPACTCQTGKCCCYTAPAIPFFQPTVMKRVKLEHTGPALLKSPLLTACCCSK